MSYNEEHNELFDLYLQGRLHGADLAAFEQRLSDDKPFAEAFQVHRILVEGIRDHGKQELKNYLKEHGKVHIAGKGTRPFNLRYAAAAAIVLIAGIYAVVHFYTKPSDAPVIAVSSSQEQKILTDSTSDYPVPEHIQENLALQEPPPVVNPKEEVISGTYAEMAPMVAEEEGPVLADAVVPPPVKDPGTLDLLKQEDDIQVLSEKRLKDTALTVPVLYVFLERDKKMELEEVAVIKETKTLSYNKANRSAKIPRAYENNAMNNNNSGNDSYKAAADSVRVIPATAGSLSKGKADKADADLSNKKMQVEFWESPVHFRGYKYSGNVIQLYSVQPTSARIFIVNGKTYLRTEEGIVYLLENCSNGCEFKPEADKQIIDFILQQP